MGGSNKMYFSSAAIPPPEERRAKPWPLLLKIFLALFAVWCVNSM
jgi:hypothetical protein